MSETPRKRAKMSSIQECRACLVNIQDDSCCVDIFRAWETSLSGMGVSIAQDLAKLASIQINVTDPYSKSICKNCCNRLKDAINFAWGVQNSDLMLRKRHIDCTDENPFWPKPIQVARNTSNALNEMTVEVKQEMLTDDEYDMNENCSEQSDPNLDIKIEPEEMTPVTHPVIEDKDLPLSQPKEIPRSNGAADYLEERLHEDVKEEPMSEDETEPSTDMPKDCMLCLKTFNTVRGLKAHVIAVHSYESVTSPRVDRANVCATCNRGFATRTDLCVHETCHSKFVCYVCDDKFDTFLQLSKHKSRQCTNTSVLPRLKTLDDVRRPAPVYYILDKNKPPKIENPIPESSIKPASATTTGPDASSIEENPAPKQAEPENNKTANVQPLKNLGTKVEDLISEWSEITEDIQPQSIATVQEKTDNEKTINIEKQGIEETLKENIEQPNKTKITCVIEDVSKSSTVNGSTVVRTEENTQTESNIKTTAIVELRSKAKDSIVEHTFDTSKQSESNTTNDSILKNSNNSNNKSNASETSAKVGMICEVIKTKENDSEVCDNIEKNSEVSYENNDSEPEVGDKIKVKESEYSNKINENESEVVNRIDMRSKVCNTTKENNSEVVDKQQRTLEVSNKNEVSEIINNENKTGQIEKRSVSNKYENVKLAPDPKATRANIQQEAIEACVNDEAISAMDTNAEIKQNKKIETFELFPSEASKAQCPSKDSMEIQLEIHSMDKDEAMEMDQVLESEIKSCTESDKSA